MVPAVEKKIAREIHLVSIVSPRVPRDQVLMETLAHVYCFSGYSLDDKSLYNATNSDLCKKSDTVQEICHQKYSQYEHWDMNIKLFQEQMIQAMLFILIS